MNIGTRLGPPSTSGAFIFLLLWFCLIYISWKNVFFFHQIRRYKTVVKVFTNVEAFQDIFFLLNHEVAVSRKLSYPVLSYKVCNNHKAWLSRNVGGKSTIFSRDQAFCCTTFWDTITCENIRFSSLFAAGDVSRFAFPPRETSPAVKSEEKSTFSQARDTTSDVS